MASLCCNNTKPYRDRPNLEHEEKFRAFLQFYSSFHAFPTLDTTLPPNSEHIKAKDGKDNNYKAAGKAESGVGAGLGLGPSSGLEPEPESVFESLRNATASVGPSSANTNTNPYAYTSANRARHYAYIVQLITSSYINGSKFNGKRYFACASNASRKRNVDHGEEVFGLLDEQGLDGSKITTETTSHYHALSPTSSAAPYRPPIASLATSSATGTRKPSYTYGSGWASSADSGGDDGSVPTYQSQRRSSGPPTWVSPNSADASNSWRTRDKLPAASSNSFSNRAHSMNSTNSNSQYPQYPKRPSFGSSSSSANSFPAHNSYNSQVSPNSYSSHGSYNSYGSYGSRTNFGTSGQNRGSFSFSRSISDAGNSDLERPSGGIWGRTGLGLGPNDTLGRRKGSGSVNSASASGSDWPSERAGISSRDAASNRTWGNRFDVLRNDRKGGVASTDSDVGESIGDGDDETATSIDEVRSVDSDGLRTESIITQDDNDDEEEEEDREDSGTEGEGEGGANDSDATQDLDSPPPKKFILVDENATKGMTKSRTFKMFKCSTHNREFELYVFLPKRVLRGS